MTLPITDTRLTTAERRTHLAYQAFWNDQPQIATIHARAALRGAATSALEHQNEIYFGIDGPMLQRAERCIDHLILLQRYLGIHEPEPDELTDTLLDLTVC